MEIKIALELSAASNQYGVPPLIRIHIQELVPQERQHDAVVYLRERVNEEFKRVTGSPAVREYAAAWDRSLQGINTQGVAGVISQNQAQSQVAEGFNNASGAVDGSEHW